MLSPQAEDGLDLVGTEHVEQVRGVARVGSVVEGKGHRATASAGGVDTNGNDRWPDRLVARVQGHPATSDLAVLNQAAGGNRVLHDGLGSNALARLDRAVFAQSGCRGSSCSKASTTSAPPKPPRWRRSRGPKTSSSPTNR
ncbi:SGNH/GDSL hydrolase family protein [Halosaccharopolyspora lacisalsi]|uniref:hypothetical protein n=1 Tax=Halosaccharopolyspora lacisalsi TaxID=1000566 RepID=UPI001F470159|nr:hypothetical protein [Halosaccharopolyspora lacisalsi]